MAISNSMAVAAAASSAESTTPSLRVATHSDQVVSQVAQHIFGEFHVHIDPETSDVHVIHASQVANPEVARHVSQLANACLSDEQIARKEKLVSGGQQKIEQLQPKINELNANIDKMSHTIANLEKELAECETAIAEKSSKNKLLKLVSKSNEAEVKELTDKKNDLQARKSGWVEKKNALLEEVDGLITFKRGLEEGRDKAHQAVRPTQQVTQFRQKLQEKLACAEERYQALGCVEHEGRAIIETPQGRYDFGLSPAALKMTIAVSLVTDEVAKDRIIRLHTSTAPDASSLATHDFYQISPQSSEASLIHKHGTPFASGGKGDVYKAFELLSKQVRVLKEIKDPDEDSIDDMQTEYTMSCAANPDNMRPGLAHKPHVCFDLRREEFGGIGLIFDLHNRGDISKQLGKLTVQDQAKGLLSLFNANSSLSANHLLHLDIKPENVFLHEGPDGLSMVVADFDGMWNLDQATDDFIAMLNAVTVPDGSPNSRTNAHVDHLIALKKKICQLDKECRRPENAGQRTKMANELKDLIDSYKVTATCVQNWGTAYTALQIVTGQYSAHFKDRDELLNILKDKIKASEPDSAEQKFLIGIMSVVSPILRAPLPTIDDETGKITDRNITTPDEVLQHIRTHVQQLGITDDRAPSVLSSTAAEDRSPAAAAAASSDPSAASGAKSSKRMSVRYDASVISSASTARRNTSPPLRKRDDDAIQQ